MFFPTIKTRAVVIAFVPASLAPSWVILPFDLLHFCVSETLGQSALRRFGFSITYWRETASKKFSLRWLRLEDDEMRISTAGYQE